MNWHTRVVPLMAQGIGPNGRQSGEVQIAAAFSFKVEAKEEFGSAEWRATDVRIAEAINAVAVKESKLAVVGNKGPSDQMDIGVRMAKSVHEAFTDRVVEASGGGSGLTPDTRGFEMRWEAGES